MTTAIKRDVRCPNPNCGKKLGETLEGRYQSMCPRCKRWITIVRRNGIDVIATAE